jgi:hypothetical protein
MFGPKLSWANAETVVAGSMRQRMVRAGSILALLSLLAVATRLDGFVIGPKGPVASIRIPLEPIGFLPPAARVLAAGGPLYTLNYVDDTHLLFTYYTRGLLPRLADATPDDNDGLVAGVLLELPSGHVVARTQWRMRDREQYLWPIGHGRFLLRIRSQLSLLNPLGNLALGDAFKEEQFGSFQRRIGYITTSPGGDLLMVETLPPTKPKLIGGAASAAALAATQIPPAKPTPDTEPKKPEVQIYFFRLVLDKKPGQPERLERVPAGVLAAVNLILVPANAEGFLSINKESRGVYLFDFHTHDGKNSELSPYETTCAPHPFFVSRSEFIAFGCHGGDKPEIGGFNLKGEHPWIEVLAGDHLSPLIVAAPAAGRFALSRTTVQGGFIDAQNLIPQDLAAQEITVRQNHDGRMLLKVMADPVQRPPQNFDLSPDGLSLAVIRTGNIEIFRLPPLSGKDQTALKLAAAMEPAKNNARVLLDSKPIASETSTPSAQANSIAPAPPAPVPVSAGNSATAATPPSSQGAAPAPASVSTAKPIELGDPNPSGDDSSERRKPPTLFDQDHPKDAEESHHPKVPTPPQ